MRDTALFRRSLAAIGLATTALLSLVWTVLEPPLGGDVTDFLAEVDAAGARATVSASAFVLSQLPFVAGVLGVAHLLRHGAPVLSNLGGALAVVGAFGHSVYGGMMLLQLSMAADAGNRDAHASVIADAESGPAAAFMAMGLLGTVLGIALLTVGLARAKVGPRWVPWTLAAFLVVEFAGANLTDWATSVSALLYLAAFTALAVVVAQSPREVWEAPAGRRPADVALASAG